MAYSDRISSNTLCIFVLLFCWYSDAIDELLLSENLRYFVGPCRKILSKGTIGKNRMKTKIVKKELEGSKKKNKP